MSFTRLTKEDAKREAGVSYTDLKAAILVVTTVVSAYSLLQGDIHAAEQRNVQAFERALNANEKTQIEYRLDVLYDRRERIKAKYANPGVISPSDSALLARTKSQIDRLEARLIHLDTIE